MVPTRGRPTEFPIKKLIAIDAQILEAVEAFRAEHTPAMNQSEAFRHILRDWLAERKYLPR